MNAKTMTESLYQPEEFNELSQHILSKYTEWVDTKEKYTIEFISLPIDEIDGLHCEVDIKCEYYDKDKEFIITLIFDYGYHLSDGTDNDETHLISHPSGGYFRVNINDEDGLRNGLCKLFEYINNLSFTKYNGCFVKKNSVCMVVNKLTKKLKNVKMSSNQCCVCYDETITRTHCGHHVCRVCLWSVVNKLQKTEDPVDIICPMCREEIGWL
jgi:hypothetical protein